MIFWIKSLLGLSEEPYLGNWNGLVFSTTKIYDVVDDTKLNRKKKSLFHTQDLSLEELFNSKDR